MTTRKQLEQLISEKFGLETRLEQPRSEEFGHYTTNAGFVLAKQMGLRRPEAGEKIAEALLQHPDVADVSVQNGFVNITLEQGAIARAVRELLKDPVSYTSSDIGKGQRILYEFVSANPTGPVNVVSARAAAVGDTLVKLAERCGYNAEAEFYVNDAGGQIKALGESVAFRLGLRPDLPEDGYKGDYLVPVAQQLAGAGLDRQELGKAAADIFLQHNLEVLKRFGTEFDHVVRESEIRHSVYREKLEQMLRGKTEIVDGAVVIRAGEIGDEKDRVIKRSRQKGGEPTYLFWDLAYHLHKAERGYHQLVNLLGPDHHAYAKTITGALRAIGIDNLRIKIIQQVHLVRAGQRVKMSKRKGEMYTMEQLMDEVGVDAARFFLLSRSTSQPLEFDIDLAKTLSKDNPVFYVQYVHARCCSLANYAREQGVEAQEPDPRTLSRTEEQRVMVKLMYLPDVVEAAQRNEEPHLLVNYLMQLASSFHGFYQKHRIITHDPVLSAQRLGLALAVRAAIAEGLGLVGVSAPERM